ncbi:MAG: corrinoid protein [Cloacibacillus porcorum]|uniref:cobalamin B12-binding domain-containing protein n=1 Tax=Cloacibacillus porcorum TaxID=1197717 RepID=UPI0023F33E85|nr:corrinoid protein [Cloacibacillus porcorum]MCD7876339.1 corrinoid protein [Cloacibacillus porcorum]
MNENILNAIAEAVLDGDVASTQKNVGAAKEQGIPAERILNDALLKGMNEVGELFRDGEMFVPEVLVSAKALQSGIEIIRTELANSGMKKTGKILTVTVEGDLHDIGIKIVGMMLEGAGFEVIHMGVDKPAEEIIEKIKQCEPDILAISAMLTTTMANMKTVIDVISEEGLRDKIKIMIGGAPTSPSFAEKIGANYSADASSAAIVAKKLMETA